MSLENIRSECSEFAALLQPYVDGELADEEQHTVSDHLERCAACRSAVSEQMWVRATLRSIEKETAPAGLRANVLAALDNAEQAEQTDFGQAGLDAMGGTPLADPGPPPSEEDTNVVSMGSRRGGRVRDLIRGGMVMIPAAAVAAGLFFVAQGGLEPVQQLPGPGLSAAMSRAPVAEPPTDSSGDRSKTAANRPGLSELDEIRPQLDFPLQVAPSRPEERVQLVGARLDPHAGASSLGARLRYRISGDHIQHIVDRQRPIGGPQPSGTTVVFRGQPYTVSHDPGGPTLHFEHGGVSHQLTLEGSAARSGTVKVDSPDFSVLLDMAHQLAREPSVRRAASR
ncbi:MAG: anti-sigma factor family protein [Nannocystales bacterium]